MKRPVVLLLGPSREAISGVTTHLNLLLPSETLAREFCLEHFQVGSEGRSEGALGAWLRLAASPFQLAAEILRRDAAIVHVNTSLDARAYWRDLAYVAVAKLCGARVLYQVHGGALPEEFCAASRLPRSWLRATLAWPDLVVVLASVEARAYRAFVPGRTTALLPNGIDCEPFRRCNRAPPDPQAPLRLLHIGRLTREKGGFDILDALAQAQGRGVAARLVIAGGGRDEQRLRSRVRELDLGERVSFAGPVFGEAKARLLSQADVLLLPSHHQEGLPYALLEGMAAGLVPVVTQVGAMPDVVTEGAHGLFVAPRDPGALAQAIAALAKDRALLARMSAACRKRVAGAFSIERVAAELREFYAGLRAARSPRTA